MSDLTIMLNTHSSCADLWPMFFGQLNKHWPNRPPCVVATNDFEEGAGEPAMFDVDGDTVINYSFAKRFTSQYLMGLCAVETPYVLTMQEDMILYGDVNATHPFGVTGATNTLVDNPSLSCFRLICSGNVSHYSMQASVWRTRRLKQLYSSVDFDTPWESEEGISRQLAEERMHIVIAPSSGRKRGRDHYDNPHFPYIATALVKGRWNAEYKSELEPLHAEYGIDASKRGWTE